MSSSVVSTLARRGLATCGVAAGSVFLAAAGATAVQAQANPCAIYGAGFVPVYGGGACVRIGGRVRVDGMAGQSQNTYTPGGVLSFAPPSEPSLDGPDRAHLRLYVGPRDGMPRTR